MAWVGPLSTQAVYSIMHQNGLLPTPHTGKQPQRLHKGKVVAMHSSLRWCSNGFEIYCWNGQVVRSPSRWIFATGKIIYQFAHWLKRSSLWLT